MPVPRRVLRKQARERRALIPVLRAVAPPLVAPHALAKKVSKTLTQIRARRAELQTAARLRRMRAHTRFATINEVVNGTKDTKEQAARKKLKRETRRLRNKKIKELLFAGNIHRGTARVICDREKKEAKREFAASPEQNQSATA